MTSHNILHYLENMYEVKKIYSLNNLNCLLPQASSNIFDCTVPLSLPLIHISSITPILFLMSCALGPSSVLASKNSKKICFTSSKDRSLSTVSLASLVLGVVNGGNVGGIEDAGIGGKLTGGRFVAPPVFPDKGNATRLFRKFRGRFGVTC